MEWRELSTIYLELLVGGQMAASTWKGCDGAWWWAMLGADVGQRVPSLDDAKDTAWAAVYRSTR